MLTWEKALERRSKSFAGSLGGKGLLQLKRAFVSFLGDAVSLSNAMIRRVDVAGTPDVPQGAAIRKALHAGLLKLRGIFTRARADAAALPVTSAKRLGTGIDTIGKRIEAQTGALGSTFDALDRRYPSQQLDQAYRQVRACRAIT
jgi:hypothetical protein